MLLMKSFLKSPNQSKVFFTNSLFSTPNEDKSATRFCCQVAAWVPTMFCNFYLVKSCKFADNSATAEAGEKNKHRFVILRFLELFDVRLTKFEN